MEKYNYYLDINFKDRTSEVEALYEPTLKDIKADPEMYAELVNDLLFHWVYGTRETPLMVLVKMQMVGEMADGGMMAKGGLTEHGLKIGDEIYDISKNDRNSIYVMNNLLETNKTTYALVDLENGERIEGIYADGGMMAKGGYADKVSEMKGGVSHYSVDIDLENGENVRDLEFKKLDKAKEVYEKYTKSMVYDGESIEDIQLIKVLKNGEYESIGGMMAKGGVPRQRKYDNGGMMAKGGYDDFGYHKINKEVTLKNGEKIYLTKGRYYYSNELGDGRVSGIYYESKDGMISKDSIDKMALGGLFGDSRYNYGRSWTLDHRQHNKGQSYETPMKNRKRKY